MYFPPCEEGLGGLDGLRFDSFLFVSFCTFGAGFDPCESEFYLCMMHPWLVGDNFIGLREERTKIRRFWFHGCMFSFEAARQNQFSSIPKLYFHDFPCISNIEILMVLICIDKDSVSETGRMRYRFPTGESGADVYDRTKQWWDSMMQRLLGLQFRIRRTCCLT